MASRVKVQTSARRGVRGRVASSSSPRVQVSEMQRSRLLSAAAATVEELGWSSASVAHITARARVSRRTFYELFDNREDCLLAILEDVVAQIEDEIAAADPAALPWRERVRAGLWTILCFFDREPALARVCVAQALRGGPRVLARREEILARLASAVDEGRVENARARECPSLTAEGLVGATLSIVHTRLTRGERGPLGELFGELMGMIVLPYLGPAAARREQRGTRTFSSGRKMPAGLKSPTRLPELALEDPLAGVPMRLTYRTALVLEAIAKRPGVSNRVVADLADVSDQGQISKLLARLQRLGLIANAGAGHAKGEPNAWTLTALGHQVAQRLGTNTRDERTVA
ncbi:MAG TPA: TetR family transcriptional regulator [Solirubrobacteraceae bacterium]|jgi:AcrR family transcriptional regulator|nr:TetR family transcriptional regulator [Solirubrobacteraceae bacterium]